MLLLAAIAIASMRGVLGDEVCYSRLRIDDRSVITKKVDCNDTTANKVSSFSVGEASFANVLGLPTSNKRRMISKELDDVKSKTTTSPTAHTKSTAPRVTSKELDDVTSMDATNPTAHTTSTNPRVTSKELGDVTSMDATNPTAHTRNTKPRVTSKELDDVASMDATNPTAHTTSTKPRVTSKELDDVISMDATSPTAHMRSNKPTTTHEELDDTTSMRTTNPTAHTRSQQPTVTSEGLDDVTTLGTTNRTAHTRSNKPTTTREELDETTSMRTTNPIAHTRSQQPTVTGEGLDDVTTLGPTNPPAGVTCPQNMVPGNCTCRRSCEDSGTCDNSSCNVTDACVCPDGFLMNGTDCVPRSECGCYLPVEAGDGIVLQEGEAYRNHGCTNEYRCDNGTIALHSYDAPCPDITECAEPGSDAQCQCSEGYTGNGDICLPSADVRDCQDVYASGIHDDGIYTVTPTNWPGADFDVYCNMADGGGWLVFQRRVDGSVDFYLDWSSYKEGFGNNGNEFWLGNDKLHYLTNQGPTEMRIDFVDDSGVQYYAKYSHFEISDEDDNYRLAIGSYVGTAGFDALNVQQGQPFTTRDRDNDPKVSNNCAIQYHGAWWYNTCHDSNLNGGYYSSGDRGLRWRGLPGGQYNIKYTEMKIRPAAPILLN